MKKLSALFVLVCAFAMAGCGTSVESEPAANVENNAAAEETQASAGDSDGKILVYLSGPEAMLTTLEEKFEAERGDVADFQIMSCGEVRSKVWTEKEAGKIQADVVFGSDPLIFNKLDEEGLLCDLSAIENVAAIGEEFSTGEHHYLFVNERYIAILYNKEAITQADAPKGFDALLDEQYAGKVIMADATQSSTALGIASSLYQLKEKSYFEGLKANSVFLSKSNDQVQSSILEGQYDLGIAPHDSVIRIQNKAKKEGYETPLAMLWPEDGAITIRRPIGVIKNDGRSEEEQKISEELVNFLLSKEAQTITSNFGFVSVRNDMENKYLPEGVKKVNIDWEAASKGEDEFKEIYEQIFQS
ncbi:MAG: extracellular solute-binding protein [Anaerotignum sp.]|nr:extracellular solute-binding protein [Anaerotignum sp.]